MVLLALLDTDGDVKTSSFLYEPRKSSLLFPIGWRYWLIPLFSRWRLKHIFVQKWCWTSFCMIISFKGHHWQGLLPSLKIQKLSVNILKVYPASTTTVIWSVVLYIRMYGKGEKSVSLRLNRHHCAHTGLNWSLGNGSSGLTASSCSSLAQWHCVGNRYEKGAKVLEQIVLPRALHHQQTQRPEFFWTQTARVKLRV